MQQPEPCRLHLLPARDAPVVVIVRRKPSRLFHVITWDTATDALVHGSWFRGKLYPLRCDVSYDGGWMVYLALGSRGDTWSGLCRLPWLETALDAPGLGTWFGGGYWSSPRVLNLNGWSVPPGRPRQPHPFTLSTYQTGYGEDEGVLYPRLERDGWRRAGEMGAMEVLPGTRKYMVACRDDPGWSWRFGPRHPLLRMFYLGYLAHGRTFAFALDEHPGLLDDRVTWATWDAIGQLVVARAGSIERYALADLARGVPSFRLSLDDLAPPAQPAS